MFLIFATTIGLVAWALHLMRRAVARREFSLMLAGFLVVSAAGALMTVYFLVQSSMGSMAEIADARALPDFDSAYFDSGYRNVGLADRS
ncbi:MAG: hypothetical protein HC857_12745 [Synechococcales cyanobacterium RU_4_20]|nr:hypothetical protein [Synechococcales cyanobacterium RU_4_20]NJR70780.1 hypothetical protein [Synechococcales cyanobacterium CRU_2_2]